MPAWPLSQKNQTLSIYYMRHAVCFTWRSFNQTLGSQMWTSATFSSAQQVCIRSREIIFGKIPLWVVIITHEHTKLLIAEYQLVTVSYSERVADFMDISHLGQSTVLRLCSATQPHAHGNQWRQSTAEKKSMNRPKTCPLNVIVNVRLCVLSHSNSFHT